MLVWLAPAPWMAMEMQPALDTPMAASVAYVDYTPAFEPPAIRIGDECFVPSKQSTRLGWFAKVDGGKATVEFEGKRIETFTRTIGKETYLPVRTIATLAGGVSEWGTKNDLRVFAVVTNVEVADGEVRVSSSLGVRPRVVAVNNPPRIVIDITGARVEAPDVIGSARVAQFFSDTVRVVVQLDKTPTLDVATSSKSTTSLTKWSGATAVEIEPLTPTVAISNPIENPPPKPAPLLFVSPPIVEKESPKEVLLRMPIRGSAPKNLAAKRDKNGIYWINLPTAAKEPTAQFLDFKNELGTVSVVDLPKGGISLRLDLTRPMGVRVSQGETSLAVRIVEPKNSGGTLRDKTIVVDAGHGGGDPGARYGSLTEKSITLPIAKYVAEGLADAGSTVVLSREGDSTTDLYSRPRLANDSNAHFFVSIHINSNGVSNSRSGTYTYYHRDDADSRLLAECIQAEIAKVSGLPDHGAASDRGPAPTKGFAVLRESTMPAVLVEVAYINHAADRKLLVSDEFRKKVAAAIVRGIKVYIGGQAKP